MDGLVTPNLELCRWWAALTDSKPAPDAASIFPDIPQTSRDIQRVGERGMRGTGGGCMYLVDFYFQRFLSPPAAVGHTLGPRSDSYKGHRGGPSYSLTPIL
ncbi:hypothetical protein RRG08_038683 [Elysia crispata]|uniref:Uncharacterized protein n=1 Tax=Elysia crispata TaxID=231223 RepID=A0AAE0ZKM2_9GAST|nr:hypothetical protein RRG08_038683 [Elysia crispata]